MRYGQTMAFTTLMMFQLFNAPLLATSGTIDRGGDRIIAPLACGDRVRSLPPGGVLDRQSEGGHWALCATIASSVLWLPELRS